MMTGLIRRACFLLLGLFAAGCCTESTRTVTIAGTVSYDAYSGGDILLMLSEGSSTRCSEGMWGGGSIQTPGVRIAQATLAQPGAFSLPGKIRWSDSAPDLDLVAWYRDGQTGRCIAGGYLILPPQSATNASLTLQDGRCPMRL